VNDTFVSKGGAVKLAIVQDNAVFEVERGQASAHQPKLTYPNGDVQTVSAKELRALFPAVVYSQGELAEIGKQAGKRAQLADLLQFVNPDYKREDDRLSQEIEAAKNAVKAAVQKLVSNWTLQAKLRQLKTNHASHVQRVKALEKTLPKQSEEDQDTIALFEKSNDFETKRIQASKHVDQIQDDLKAAVSELLDKRDLKSELSGNSSAYAEAYGDLFKTFKSGIESLRAKIQDKRSALTAVETLWAEDFKRAREARDAVLEKFGEHRTVTAQIIKLQEEVTELTNQIGDQEAQIKAAGDPSTALQGAINSLKEKNKHRAERTQEWANKIEELSSGKIQAKIDLKGDVSEVFDAIDFVANKTGSQEATRIKGLEEALATDVVEDITDRLRAECLSIVYWKRIGSSAGEEQPECLNLMKILGNTERIKTALVDHIDSTRVEVISTAISKPEILLSYCDGDRQISFEKASEGQRAAALLFMLLEQPGGPLIIDQPEGDLDNKIVTDLTEKLHSAKQKRQIIFASHNANIVVNGASELVAYLDINVGGDRKISHAGAIDRHEIRDVITSTMEGGEKAFKNRQDKYGY